MWKNSKIYNIVNYEKYRWTPERKQYRAKLNKANRERWTYWNGDWKDLVHIDLNPKNFSKSNLRTGSAKKNRSDGAKKANKIKAAKK